MSLEDLHRFSSHPAAAAAALILLVGATVWLDKHNPKKNIEARFEQRFRGQENPYFSTDSAFGFKPASLYKMLENYQKDEKGEKDDFKDHRQFIRYDFVYPFAYAIPFAVFILCLQASLSPEPANRVWWLFLIPLAAGLFDFGENFGMSRILSGFEADKSSRPDGLVYFTVAMNVLKWLMVFATLTLILSGVAGLLLRKAYRFKP